MSQHVSAAVISGGLDCKLIHWDVSSKSILGSRQAGMRLCMKVPSELSCGCALANLSMCACVSAAVHLQHKTPYKEAFRLLGHTALPIGSTILGLAVVGYSISVGCSINVCSLESTWGNMLGGMYCWTMG